MRCSCRFVLIAATHYNHMSAACVQTGKVYMWGQCRGQSVTAAIETQFHSIHDVFACFASPPVTWTPLEIGTQISPTKLHIITRTDLHSDDGLLQWCLFLSVGRFVISEHSDYCKLADSMRRSFDDPVSLYLLCRCRYWFSVWNSSSCVTNDALCRSPVTLNSLWREELSMFTRLFWK